MNLQSQINTFKCSNGETVLKSKLNTNVSKAKDLKKAIFEKEHGYLFCEDCGKNKSAVFRIDPSHTISVKFCQETNRSELAWNQTNIRYRCNVCHDIHDAKTNLEREEIFNQLNGL